jgi:periplasmic protein TonB
MTAMSTISHDGPRVERRLGPRTGASRRLFNQLVFSGRKHRGRLRALWIPVMILQVAVLAAVVLVPLLRSVDLPQPTTSGGIVAFFVEPVAAPPPPPPPPAPPKAAAVTVSKPTKTVAPKPTVVPSFVAPIEVPPDIPEPQVAGSEGLVSAPDTGVAGGVEGGVPGGVEGGVVGGVEGGVVGGTPGGVVGGAVEEVPKEEPPPPSAPVRVGGKIKEPRKLKNVAPAYPDIAKQARVQGVVVLEATIDPSGRVENVRVLRGIPLLNESALDAVRRWVYSPTLLNGVPVAVIMTVTVNFTLGG